MKTSSDLHSMYVMYVMYVHPDPHMTYMTYIVQRSLRVSSAGTIAETPVLG